MVLHLVIIEFHEACEYLYYFGPYQIERDIPRNVFIKRKIIFNLFLYLPEYLNWCLKSSEFSHIDHIYISNYIATYVIYLLSSEMLGENNIAWYCLGTFTSPHRSLCENNFFGTFTHFCEDFYYLRN